MSPVDPTRRLANPYARTDGADCPARVAGRALAVGALGLGAVAVFTGTASADEAPTAEDTISEVTADEAAPEPEGRDEPVEDAEPQPAAEGEVLQFASGADAPANPEDLMFYSGVAQAPDGWAGDQEEASGEPVGAGGLPPGPASDPDWEFSDPDRHYDAATGGWVLGPGPDAADSAQDETPREPDAHVDAGAEPGTATDDAPAEESSGEPVGESDLPPGPPSDPDWEFSDPDRHYDAATGGWVLGPGPEAADSAQEGTPREPDAFPETAAGAGLHLLGERLADRQERLADRQERLAQRQERLAQRQELRAQRQELRAAGRGGVPLTDPDAVPDVSPALAATGSTGGDLFPGSSARGLDLSGQDFAFSSSSVGGLGGGYLFPGFTS